ncbi:hypothetical protein KPH14_009759 [Odynerus spinipes]|uniref:CCHC-type domain-containing protein n=1 Tax=Odynerus spinipes TaxID=1348599 RepID=A0AAD9RFP9_9HYME|nr:hypothetical protein KPH14_009759 [Odynerus spinipes]
MTADYSSHQTNLGSTSPTTTTMNNVNQQPASYAAALQTSPFPTKDQAIVIDTVEGIPIKDYVLAVTFEHTTFWIYISTDIVTCFDCKQTGHLAKDCSINVTITETAVNTTEPIQKLTQTQGVNTALQPLQNKVDNATINNNTGDIDCDIGKLTSNQKRPLSSASSSAYTPSITRNNKIDWCLTSDDSSYEVNSKETKTKLYKKKKPKIESCDSNNTERESTDNHLLLVKNHLNEHNDEQYLTYLQLRSFLEKSKGCADITEVNREFAEDTNKIISTLRYTYPLLTESLM